MPTSSRSRVTAVLLAAVVLIGGANLAAYAANGQPLLMGKTNTATKKTTVKNNGSGPALHLKTQPGQAPLKVNRTKKVNKLNADLVDGASAADLKTLGERFDLPGRGSANQHAFAFPGLPPGRYLMSYSVVTSGATEPLCFIATGDALGYGSAYATYHVVSGSTIVDTTTAPVELTCAGGGPYAVLSDANVPSQASFVRLDLGSTSAATAVRGTPGRAPAGPLGR